MALDVVPEYWRRADVYLRFLGAKCEKCGHSVFPPAPVCPKCGSRTKIVELPRGGRLLAWTVVESAPSEWREQTPLIIGCVELDDGTRVIAQLTDVRVDELREGMRVRAVVRRAPDRSGDVIRYIVKFVPDWYGEEHGDSAEEG